MEFENDLAHWEKVGWQYYQRFVLVNNLYKRLSNEMEKEWDDQAENRDYLSTFLMAPPIRVRFFLDTHPTDESRIFCNAAEAFKIHVKRNQVEGTMSRLVTASVKGAVKWEIPLTESYKLRMGVKTPYRTLIVDDVHPALASIFKDYPKLIEDAEEEGKNDGVNLVLLNLTNKGFPISRRTSFERAKTLMELSQTINSGYVGYHPTVFDKIDLRFYYPSQEVLPELSIVVNPL